MAKDIFPMRCMHLVDWSKKATLVVTSCVVVFTSTAVSATNSGPADHVIVVSIDALLPEYVVPGEKSADFCPNMSKLRAAGGYAERAIAVYPTLTYPNHAAIATGVGPGRNGIVSNGLFSIDFSESRGAWFADDLDAPAIWDITHAAGMTAAAFFWPVSVGAEGLTWNLPEFWHSEHGSEIVQMRRFATPGLMGEIEVLLDDNIRQHLNPIDKRDALATTAALHVFEEHRPNLMLIHFLEADKIQHRVGRGGEGLGESMRTQDAHVGAIWDKVEELGLSDRTVLIVLGDHGFSDTERMLGVNAHLISEGLIKLDEDGEIEHWDGIVHATGNSAGVYFRDGASEAARERVRSEIEAFAVDSDGNRRFTIIERDELDRLGGHGPAAFWLEGEPGIMFSNSFHRSWIDRASSMRGNHGGHPHKYEMATGFMISGAGIKAGTVAEEVLLVDVAPTIAALLGLEFPDSEGRVLDEFFID